MRALLVAKPVSWTLDPDRPRKTGSRYNDTLSCYRKPKGSVTMSQKVTVLFHCLLGDFWLKLPWGYSPPPLPGEGLRKEGVRHGTLLWGIPEFWKSWNAKFRRNVNKPVNINGYSNDTDIANEFVVHFNKVFRHDDDKNAYNDFSHKRAECVRDNLQSLLCMCGQD